MIQAIFDIGIPILGTLIWACPNLMIHTAKTTNISFNLLGHVIDIKQEKKPNKINANYCMYCLQSITVVICLKRTEV